MSKLQEPSVPGTETPNPAAEAVLAIGTAPESEASELARVLVSERLVACVNLFNGARSIYRRQGHVCDEAETAVVMKTTRAELDSLVHRYVEIHSDDVPEFLVVPIAAGHAAYLGWITQATTLAS